MVKPALEREILEVLGALSEEKQRDVLSFARQLTRKAPTTPSSTLLKFVGTLSPETCDKMEKAIAAG